MYIEDFYNKKILFIHIPKTGGCSIEFLILDHYYSLIDKTEDLEDRKVKIKKHLSHDGQWTQHFSLIENIEKFNIVCTEDFFKFAFVRNPWDRALSEYFYVKKMGCLCHRDEIRNLTFEQYLLQDFDCSWRNHIATQASFIKNKKGEIDINFLGRFEDFESDCQKAFNELSISLVKKIPHFNFTRTLAQKRKKPYWLFYNQLTKKIVKERYEEDIDLFKYSFK